MKGEPPPFARNRGYGTAAEVIAELGKAVVVRYAPERPKRFPVPVLIVAPLLVKPYILDLAPGLSFVDYLSRQGFDLFLLDFGTPDLADCTRRFEHYLEELHLAVEKTLARARAPSLTLLGYCLGGLFGALYTTVRPDPVKNLIALATPFDFSQGGPLYRWLHGLDVDRLVDTFGNIPGEWIRDQIRLFSTRTRPDLGLRIWFNFLLRLWDRAYLERQALLSRWLQDLRPFPGEAYRQFVKEFIQGNKLVKGDLLVGGQLIDPTRIRCPLLVLAHTHDLLAPPGSAKALLDLVSSPDGEFVEISGGGMGHVDIVIGDEGPGVTWPKVAAWLIQRSAG
jgi:polyhydroxyalkanoate synthase